MQRQIESLTRTHQDKIIITNFGRYTDFGHVDVIRLFISFYTFFSDSFCDDTPK